jgi:hypothetical protein
LSADIDTMSYEDAIEDKFEFISINLEKTKKIYNKKLDAHIKSANTTVKRINENFMDNLDFTDEISEEKDSEKPKAKNKVDLYE